MPKEQDVPHLQKTIPDNDAADQCIENSRKQAASIDANDILYSLESSNDYDPEPGLGTIKTKLFALNFDSKQDKKTSD